MGNKGLETAVGLFVLLGVGALLFLSLKVGNLNELGGGDSYRALARFNNIGGLKRGAPVRISGVSIGWVEQIRIDRQDYQAEVTMRIFSRHDNIPSDSSASIYTSGLLGEQYVGITPGGEEVFLEDGGNILLTDDAVLLEKVIGQLLYRKAAGD